MTIDDLKQAIVGKDKAKVIEVLSSLKVAMEGGDQQMMLTLTEPAVINELHELLIGEMGVNPRMLQLRVRQPHRGKRAMLFIQTMTNGVNYLV